MADEKTTVKAEGTDVKEAKQKKDSKFIAFFKRLPKAVATPFKNMWHELRKVTWPTRKDLISYTGIVIVFMVFMGVVIGLLDMGASKLVAAISSLVKTEDTTAAIEPTAAPEGVTAPEATETVGGESTQTGDTTSTSGK